MFRICFLSFMFLVYSSTRSIIVLLDMIVFSSSSPFTTFSCLLLKISAILLIYVVVQYLSSDATFIGILFMPFSINYSSSLIDNSVAILFSTYLFLIYNFKVRISIVVDDLINLIPTADCLMYKTSFGIFSLRFNFFKNSVS